MFSVDSVEICVSHLRELSSLPDFVKLYRVLGRRAEYAKEPTLEGTYEARWLPLGACETSSFDGCAGRRGVFRTELEGQKDLFLQLNHEFVG